MAGKQEGIKGVAKTVLQDPRGMVKARLLKAQFQEVSARLTGKTSATGTSSARRLKHPTGNSVNGLNTSTDNPRNYQRWTMRPFKERTGNLHHASTYTRLNHGIAYRARAPR